MKSKKSIIAIILLAVCVLSASACFLEPIKVESEKLTVDATCYIGNYNCPKLSVKVKNTSSFTYYVYVNANFYYKSEFVTSESSKGVTLAAGDEYTFEIQSSMGTKYFIDQDNWSYKITSIHYNQK